MTLELGGKSPVFVDRTADLDIAAKRLVFGTAAFRCQFRFVALLLMVMPLFAWRLQASS